MDLTARQLLRLLDRHADILFALTHRRISHRHMSAVLAARSALFEASATVVLLDEIDALPDDERESVMKQVKALIRDIGGLVDEIQDTKTSLEAGNG